MPEDEFEIYLTLLAKTLRLKGDQRDAIAAELRDHMVQRLDELTKQGLSREEAIGIAIEEFGDASALAKDLTKTNPTKLKQRRHLMQTSFGTIAACAVVTFAIVILNPFNKNGQPTQPQAEAIASNVADTADTMAALIERESGITYQNTAKIILRGDEASGTAGKEIVLDMNIEEIQKIWDTIYQSRPYDHWALSGYRQLDFYSNEDSDEPDITLYINETSATHTSKNGKRFRCPGLPELIRKIWKSAN